MHKVALIVLGVLVAVASISFAVELGGSTTGSIAGNKDEQKIIVEQEVDIDVGILHFDIDGEVAYIPDVKETSWEYEIGASVPISVFTFGSTIGGDNEVKLGDVAAYVDMVYENIGADIDFLFSADEGKDAFQGAEFSVFFDIGSLACRVGYMWTENGEPDVNTPEALIEGGFYATGTITY